MFIEKGLASRLFVCLAIAALAACSGAGGGSTVPVSTPVPKSLICPGQKDSGKYASLDVTLSAKGGSFCVPAFGGFGGTISYPLPKPSVKLTVTSSTTDYDKMPHLGPGTAIFYLQLALSGAVSFGPKVNPTGGLTSPTIKSGTAYTMYGEALVEGAKLKIGPCYSTATSGPHGGVIPAIGALFEFANIPAASNAFIEVYTGESTQTKC